MKQTVLHWLNKVSFGTFVVTGFISLILLTAYQFAPIETLIAYAKASYLIASIGYASYIATDYALFVALDNLQN